MGPRFAYVVWCARLCGAVPTIASPGGKTTSAYGLMDARILGKS